MNMFAAVPEVLPSSAFHLDEKLGNGQDRFVVAVIDRTTGIMWKPLSSFDGAGGNTKFKKMIQLNAGWDDSSEPVIPPVLVPPIPSTRKTPARPKVVEPPIPPPQTQPSFAGPNPEMNIMKELAIQYHVSSDKVAQEVSAKITASPDSVVRCGHCGCRFTSKSSSIFASVKAHPLIHLKEKAFRCGICNTLTNEFNDHMQTRHPTASLGPDDELIRPEIAEEATRMLFQCFPDFGWRDSEEQDSSLENSAVKRPVDTQPKPAQLNKRIKIETIKEIVASKKKLHQYLKGEQGPNITRISRSPLTKENRRPFSSNSEEESHSKSNDRQRLPNRYSKEAREEEDEDDGSEGETNDESEPLGLQYNRAIRVLARRMNQSLKKGKPAYCATCNFGFVDPTRQLQKVRTHLSTHLNGKVFKCHLCPSKVNEIASHLRQAHMIIKATEPPQLRDEIKVKAFENICLCFPEYITCLTPYVPAIISAAHTSKAMKRKAVLVVKKGPRVNQAPQRPSGVVVSRSRGPLTLKDIQKPTLTLSDIVSQKPDGRKTPRKYKPRIKVDNTLESIQGQLVSVFENAESGSSVAPKKPVVPKLEVIENRPATAVTNEPATESAKPAPQNDSEPEKTSETNSENEKPAENENTDRIQEEMEDDGEEEVIEASIDPEPLTEPALTENAVTETAEETQSPEKSDEQAPTESETVGVRDTGSSESDHVESGSHPEANEDATAPAESESTANADVSMAEPKKRSVENFDKSESNYAQENSNAEALTLQMTDVPTTEHFPAVSHPTTTEQDATNIEESLFESQDNTVQQTDLSMILSQME